MRAAVGEAIQLAVAAGACELDFYCGGDGVGRRDGMVRLIGRELVVHHPMGFTATFLLGNLPGAAPQSQQGPPRPNWCDWHGQLTKGVGYDAAAPVIVHTDGRLLRYPTAYSTVDLYHNRAAGEPLSYVHLYMVTRDAAGKGDFCFQAGVSPGSPLARGPPLTAPASPLARGPPLPPPLTPACPRPAPDPPLAPARSSTSRGPPAPGAFSRRRGRGPGPTRCRGPACRTASWAPRRPPACTAR